MTTKLIITLNLACTTLFSYSQVTPDSVIFNIVGQPNIQVYYEKGNLNYYGSGDVTDNTNIDFLDVDAIYSGVSNIMADVNADNKVDSTDAEILDEYVNGARTHLPGQWNVLTKEEKKDWVLKTYRNVYMKEHKLYYSFEIGDSILGYTNWNCETYSRQANMENFGVIKVNDYITWLESIGSSELKYPENVAKFNIPSYLVSLKTLSEESHQMLAYFIGNDLNFEVGKAYDISNFLFVDGQTGQEVTPGTTFMSNTNNNLSVYWEGHYHSNVTNTDKFMSFPLVNFTLDNNILTCTSIESKLTEQLNKIVPKYTKSSNRVVSYDDFKAKGLEALVSESLPKDVYDNYDLAPTTEYSFESGQTTSGNCSDFSFDVDVVFTAKNRFDKENVNDYKIQVRDEVKPYFTYFPEDIHLTAEEAAGDLSPAKTGYAVSEDNTGISMNNYEYVKTGESETERFYDAVITASDLCENDSTRVQKVVVDKPNGIPTMEGTQDKCKLKIYPNPAEGNVTIEYNTKGKSTIVSIYSMSGQNLENFILERNRVKHNFSKYAPGIYTIQIIDDGKAFSIKFIIR